MSPLRSYRWLSSGTGSGGIVGSEWGLALGTPFESATASFVAPADDHLVLKVPSEGDDESLHEGDALELWGSDIAVRIIRRDVRSSRDAGVRALTQASF